MSIHILKIKIERKYFLSMNMSPIITLLKISLSIIRMIAKMVKIKNKNCKIEVNHVNMKYRIRYNLS